MTTAVYEQLSALADDTRGRVLCVLDRNELTVGELTQVLQLPQSTVSRHLKVLSDAGWVTSRAEGTSRLYALSSLEGSDRKLWQLVRTRVEESAAARHDLVRLERVLAERRQRSRDFFSTSAGQWDAMRAELFGDRSDITALLGLLDPAWVVGDLGCGTGRLTEALAPFVGSVVAIDESRGMLAMARRRLGSTPNVEFRSGDVMSLPVENGELNAAVLGLVLNYATDPVALLIEVRRSLARGGRILIIDMQPHDREELRARTGQAWMGISSEQLGAWLSEAGFSSVRYVPLSPDPQAKGPPLFSCTATR
jgi:ubiquinone/menaquinone biosynthesis C-methylase UbiE/DNA-binding transcriptional ArsR family regulator